MEKVRFDPTVSAQGQPNPFGFLPVMQYVVDIPNYEEQDAVVQNIDDDPNLQTFFTTFVTSDGFLRELVPPEVEQVYSIPDRFQVNPLTGQWPGNGTLAIQFSEPMDPSSFLLGGPAGGGRGHHGGHPVPGERRGQPGQPRRDRPGHGLGRRIPGSFTYDPSATIYYFKPTFSFGDGKFVFTVQVFQGLTDLSGNRLVNPRSFGPYQVDGTGLAKGEVLEETFDTDDDQDRSGLSPEDLADWGAAEEGLLQGQPVTRREAYLYWYHLQGTRPGGTTTASTRPSPRP